MDRFGLRAGIEASRMSKRGGQRVVGVRLPHVGHTLWARPGTSDPATFDEVFLSGEYNLPFEGFAPDTILDLGANVGYTSVLFASRWPNARVLAVEPSSENFGMLQQNIAAWPNVTAVHAAVWSHSGPLEISNPEGDPNAFRVSEAAPASRHSVQGMTLMDLIHSLGEERVSLIKMDVEGAEAELFKTSADWLDRTDVLVVELHDRLVPGCAQGLCDGLRGRSFRQEIMGQNLAIDFR